VHDLFPDILGANGESETPSLREIRDQAEKRHIERVLVITDGQLKATADMLGVSRTTLWEKMHKLGFSRVEEN